MLAWTVGDLRNLGGSERGSYVSRSPGTCGLGWGTGDTIHKEANKPDGYSDAGCREGARRAEARVATLDRMVRGGLSRCHTGASSEGEAEENLSRGSQNKDPEARASWASVAVAERGGGLYEGQILRPAIDTATPPARIGTSTA